MKRSASVTEAEILDQIVAPGQGDLGLEAAKSILELRFNRRATARIKSLLRANNSGKIADTQRFELEKYIRVGQLLDLLRAKARLSLAPRRAA